MAVTEKLFTAEDVARLPEPKEGGKIELVAGRVLYMPPPFQNHGVVQTRIAGPLDAFATDNDLGYVATDAGFLLARDPDTVRAPDVSFVAWSKLPDRRAPMSFLASAPDLAVEVKSSDDSEAEVLAKAAAYLQAGTPRVWLARPRERTIAVHYPDGSAKVFGEGDTLTSTEAGFSIDGFQLPVARIFALI